MNVLADGGRFFRILQGLCLLLYLLVASRGDEDETI